MRNIGILVAFLVVATAAFAQNQPPRGGSGQGPQGPQAGPPPANLKALGLSEADVQAIEADVKAFEEFNQTSNGEEQKLDEQKKQLTAQDTIDRDAYEKAVRAGSEIQVKRQMTRLDLLVKWRSSYGVEKAKKIEPLLNPRHPGLQGPQGPGQPDQPPPQP